MGLHTYNVILILRKDGINFIRTKVVAFFYCSPFINQFNQSHSGMFNIVNMDTVQVGKQGGGSSLFMFFNSVLTASTVVNYHCRPIIFGICYRY